MSRRIEAGLGAGDRTRSPEDRRHLRVTIIWSAVSAVVAALITGGATVVAAVVSDPGETGAGPGPASTVTVTVTETSGTAPATGGGTAPPAGVRWKGELTLTEDYADLDVVPPQNAAETSVSDLRLPYGKLEVEEKSLRWTERQDPTREACEAGLRAHGFDGHSYEEPVQSGQRYCVETGGGRVALLDFRSDAKVDNSAYHAEVEVTVWKNADD